MKLTAMTDPGAGEPAALQQRFPDSERWLVFDEIVNLDEEESEKLMPLVDESASFVPNAKNTPSRLEKADAGINGEYCECRFQKLRLGK